MSRIQITLSENTQVELDQPRTEHSPVIGNFQVPWVLRIAADDHVALYVEDPGVLRRIRDVIEAGLGERRDGAS